MTTNKRNQNRTGQLSTRNIFYQTIVAVTQFIQQEAQLSTSDRAMRLVSSNLTNYHATV